MSKQLWGMMACSENLEADVKMYESMFNLKASDEWEGCISFTFGYSKLYVMSAPDAPPIIVLQVEDIKAEIERLRNEGFEVMDPFKVQVGIFTFYEDKKGAQYGLLQLTSK